MEFEFEWNSDIRVLYVFRILYYKAMLTNDFIFINIPTNVFHSVSDIDDIDATKPKLLLCHLDSVLYWDRMHSNVYLMSAHTSKMFGHIWDR